MRLDPAAALIGAVALVLSFGVARTAAASTPGECAAPAGIFTTSPPWAQKSMEPDRLRPLTDGDGVLVAVLSTGVDAGNAQLTGAVANGIPLVGGRKDPADRDCDGRGTLVAGIIAARPDPRTSIVGVAPGAQLLPIRVTQTVADGNGRVSQAGGDAATLATAIRLAADRGATIVCVAVTTAQGSAELEAAVRDVTAAGVLVVSGGTVDGSDGATEQYPSAYDEVLAVAATQRDGKLLDSSQRGSFVDLLAPGGGVIGTAPVGQPGDVGHTAAVDDASAATAYVAGVAALVRQRHPDLDPGEIVSLLSASALPSVAGAAGEVGGAGHLDAYAAVATTPVAARRPEGGTARPPVIEAGGLSGLETTALIALGTTLVTSALMLVTVGMVRSGRGTIATSGT